MGKVGHTADARVLLETLHNAEQAREPEAQRVERDQDLRSDLANDGVAEIVKPVILVSVARERVLRPVVDGMDACPQHGHDV